MSRPTPLSYRLPHLPHPVSVCRCGTLHSVQITACRLCVTMLVHKPWWFLPPARSGCSIHTQWGFFWSVQKSHILLILQYPLATRMPTQSHCTIRSTLGIYARGCICSKFQCSHSPTHPYYCRLISPHCKSIATLFPRTCRTM